jgi:hypothetical protein
MASIVQHLVAQTSANQTTVVATVTSTGSARLLVVALGNGGGRTVSTITDNIGNTYVQASGAAATETADTFGSDVWYVLSAASGVTTITVTFSGAAGTFNKQCFFWEVSGFTTAAFDGANAVSNGTTTASTATGAAVTTTSTNGFVVGIVIPTQNVTGNPAAGNEFTSGGDISPTSDAACALISATAASHTPAWDLQNDGSFASSTAAWKETAAAGPTLPWLPVTRSVAGVKAIVMASGFDPGGSAN